MCRHYKVFLAEDYVVHAHDIFRPHQERNLHKVQSGSVTCVFLPEKETIQSSLIHLLIYMFTPYASETNFLRRRYVSFNSKPKLLTYIVQRVP